MREQSTEFVRLILDEEGFTVTDIEVCPDERRADLFVSYGSEEYIIEAKSRAPHQGWNELMKRARTEGGATTSRRIDPWNALSSTILEAYQQLLSTPAPAEVFRVLWCVVLHDDGEFVKACMKKRLLGTERLVAIELPVMASTFNKPPKIIDCHYHGSNDFERCPKLDAAVVFTREGGQLLVNMYSEQRARFRSSCLHTIFSKYNAVIDAEVAEQRGEAFMLGCDFVGPRNGKSQWVYIRDRYGVGTSIMIDQQFNALATMNLAQIVNEVE
jgi:hypothetical protein